MKLLFWLFFLSACSAATPSEDPSVSTIDRAGNELYLLAPVERVVSLAPSITQIIEDIGAAPLLVGADTWSEHPDLPQLDMVTPDLEVLLSLQPDLVLASGLSFGPGSQSLLQLQEAGIAVARIPTSSSLREIEKDIVFIATILGLETEGQRLIEEMETQLSTLRVTSANEPVRVLFEISPLPEIFSFGHGVFLNELIEIAGGENVLSFYEGWLAVSEETAVDLNPEVIFTSVEFIDDPVGEILARPAWQGVDAVKYGRVFQIDNELSSQANHRVVGALRQMLEAIGE